MDGTQNSLYYRPEFVHVQTVLRMLRHKLKMKAITIDMLGQESEPKRKSIRQRRKKSTYQGKTWQNFIGRNFKRSLHRL
jgi:hypothetical protein